MAHLGLAAIEDIHENINFI